MKSKLITSSLALLSLGMMGEVVAEEGRNSFEVNIRAELAKAASEENVQIRLYHKGVQLPGGQINVDLEQTKDTAGNLAWGIEGTTFNGEGIDRGGMPKIGPDNVYVIEVYSTNNITYKKVVAGCHGDITLHHSSGTGNVLTAVCGASYPLTRDQLYVGNAGQVPNALTKMISSPLAFMDTKPVGAMTYSVPEDIAAGDALYLPVAFYAHLPGFGSNIDKRQPGIYEGNGSMVVQASWE